MKLRNIALVSSLAALTPLAFAGTDANQFTLVLDSGKTVGKASYTIDKVKDGTRVRAHYQYRLYPSDIKGSTLAPSAPAGDGGSGGRRGGGGSGGGSNVEAQINAEYKVDEKGNYLSGYAQDTGNQLMISYTPSKKRDELGINMAQGGAVSNADNLALPKPDFLIVQLFDPSALQILISTAILHPHADSTYLLGVPTPGAGQRVQLMYVTFQAPPAGTAASGTLDGKPASVRHFLINFHEGTANVYIDDNDNLLEADLGPYKAKYIRNGFVLGTVPAAAQ